MDLGLVRRLLRYSSAEREQKRAEWQTICDSCITSQAALSQSATFDLARAQAGLEALEYIDSNPGVCGDGLPAAATLGHTMRFQPIQAPQGVMFGP